MRTHSTSHDGMQLLDAISGRLDLLGLPTVAPLHELESRPTFDSLRINVIERLIRAAEAGIDVRAAFEIDERSIADAASRLAQRWHDLDGQLLESDLPWTSRRPHPSNRYPKRWFKKVLLKRERQITDFVYMMWQKIGSSAMPVISDAVLQSKNRQNQLAEKYAKEHEFATEIDQTPVSMPFAETASSAKKRSSKLYVRAVGLEKYCTKRCLQGFFVTLTLPGQYHPNPTKGQNTWNGITPAESHDELQRKWRQFQREFGRKFGKVLGVRVEEPHQDGCPHWHLLIYVDSSKEAPLRELFGRFFGDETAAKVEPIDPQKGKGATYIMKYILPVLQTESDTLAARYQAHRATWGKRAVQFFDRPGSSTLWDQMRRIKLDSKEFRELSDYARKMHEAACSNDYCQFLCLLDGNVLKRSCISTVDQVSQKKRVTIWYTARASDVDATPLGAPSTPSKKIQGVVDHSSSSSFFSDTPRYNAASSDSSVVSSFNDEIWDL